LTSVMYPDPAPSSAGNSVCCALHSATSTSGPGSCVSAPLPALIFLQLFGRGCRAHKRHISFNDLNQLRKFVEAELRIEASHRGKHGSFRILNTGPSTSFKAPAPHDKGRHPPASNGIVQSECCGRQVHSEFGRKKSKKRE